MIRIIMEIRETQEECGGVVRITGGPVDQGQVSIREREACAALMGGMTAGARILAQCTSPDKYIEVIRTGGAQG